MDNNIFVQPGERAGKALVRTNEKDGVHTPVYDFNSDSANFDAFSRLRVSEPITIFDSKQIHSKQPLFWDDQLITGSGGSSVWSQATASTVLSVDLNTAANRVRQTRRRFNYQPGKSQLIFMTGTLGEVGGGTGITRAMGAFDDANGIFMRDNQGVVEAVVRSSTTGSVVDNAVAQSDWNTDKLDGTGASGLTLDGSKSQILIIDYEWLSVGRVRIGFIIDGLIIYVHHYHHSNIISGAYMSTPNLPLRYEITNDGTGVASSLEHICSTVISEGGAQNIGINRCNSNQSTAVVAATAFTIYALCGIRLNASNLDGVVKVLSKSVIELNTVDYEWMIIMNPVIAGTAPTFTQETSSNVDFAVGVAANTVTLDSDSVVQAAGYVKGGRETGSSTDDLDSAQLVGSLIDGTQDQLWLCVRPLSANADFMGSILWREIS